MDVLSAATKKSGVVEKWPSWRGHRPLEEVRL